MKLTFAFAAVILTLSILFAPYNILAQENEASGSAEVVDIYALFWPVVPGKTVADPFFWAKQLKETFSSIFSFGEINKSRNLIEISEKRFVEGSKLFEAKDFSNAFKSLELNKKARDEAVKLKKQALEKKQDVKELTSRLVDSLEKQQKALMFLETQLPEDQKGKIAKIVQDLTLQISEAK